MPNEAAHLALAERNQKTINLLLSSVQDYGEWITTVAFYKALHLVEAVFANDPDILHGRNHEDREQFLKRTNKYSNIYKHYRPLWAASTVARYLEDGGTRVQHSCFFDYLPAAQIEATILKHYLHQLETSARKMLAKKAAPDGDKKAK